MKKVFPILFGFLLFLGTATVFHPCEIKEDGTWMHCHDVQSAVMAFGIGLTVLFIISAIIKNRIISGTGYGIAAAAAGVLFFLPGDIMQMCMMHTMRCYAVMRPFVRIMCVLIFISAALRAVQEFKNK